MGDTGSKVLVLLSKEKMKGNMLGDMTLAKIADDLNQSKNKVYKLLAGLNKCVLHMSY